MNTVLWVVQVLLALHTAMGAVWKFSNSTQVVPSLSAIPHSVWLGISVLELICSLALIAPVISLRLGCAVPVAAILIALVMLVYCGLHLSGGHGFNGQVIYWLVVATVCAFVAYGRLVLVPFE